MCHLLQKPSCKSPLPPAKYDLSPSPWGCHNALYFPLTSSQSACDQHSSSVLLVPESELLKTGGTSFFLSKFGKGQMWSYHLPTFHKCPVCSLLTYLNFRHLGTCWISSPGPRWHLSAHLILPQTHHPHLAFPGWSFCSFHTNSFTKSHNICGHWKEILTETKASEIQFTEGHPPFTMQSTQVDHSLSSLHNSLGVAG